MKQSTLECIEKELKAARAKFPNPNQTMAALTEEVGEVAKALLHNDCEDGAAYDVFCEAIQTAVMAIRLLEEGDRSFPNYAHQAVFPLAFHEH